MNLQEVAYELYRHQQEGRELKKNTLRHDADNASSAKVLIADQAYSPYQFAWDQVGVVMKKNGEVMQTGTGAVVLGHSVRSVVELAHMLAREGEAIEPGWWF